MLDNLTVSTDANGNFLMLDPPVGEQVVLIDGDPAGSQADKYPTIPVTLTIVANRLNELPYLPHLHKQHQRFTPIHPTQKTTATDPDLPGVVLHLEAGNDVIGWDGKRADKVSIRTVPADRLPIRPVPAGVRASTVYMFYFGKRGGGTPQRPVPFEAPNEQGLAPGTKVTLWYFDESPRKGERPLCLLAHWYRYLRVYDPANAKWAIARAEEAIARGDRSAEAYLTIGIVNQRQGRPEQALRALEQATRHDPRLAHAAWLLATISAERGDLARSYRVIRAAVEAGSVDPFYLDDAHRILADRLGDLQADVKIMSRVLLAAPDNLRAHRHLAYSTAVLGDEPRALIHYQRAVALDPNDPTNWEGVGWTLARLERYEESIAAYRRAVALAPYRHEPHEALGRLHEHKRRHRDAMLEYENAIRLGDRKVNTLLSLCVARYNLSEFEGSTPCFREVLARDSGNATAQRYLPQSDNNARLRRGGR